MHQAKAQGHWLQNQGSPIAKQGWEVDQIPQEVTPITVPGYH